MAHDDDDNDDDDDDEDTDDDGDDGDDDGDDDDEYPVTGSLDEIPMLAQVILTPLTSLRQPCLLKTK